jgi:hypothetical protein
MLEETAGSLLHARIRVNNIDRRCELPESLRTPAYSDSHLYTVIAPNLVAQSA